MRGDARTWIVGVALLAFVGCCLVGPGGLRTSWHAADVSYYAQLGSRLTAGSAPYRSLYVEYPPGALPIFVIPSVSQTHYVELFKVLMAVLGAAAIVATAVAASAASRSPARVALAVAPLAVAPVLLGSVFLNRFDVWPAFLTVLGLAILLRGRSSFGAGALALAVAAKIFAAAALPVAAVHVARTRGGDALRRAAAVLVGVVVLCVAPFALVGPGGLAYSFYIQLTRHLELESLGASVLLAAGRLGLYHVRLVDGAPGSRDLAGGLATGVGVVSTLVELVALLAPAVWYLRGPETRERFLVAFAAAVAAYVTFGKVLSPQYLVWLLPLVPLVGGRVGVVATGILAVAMGLTHAEFAHWDSLNALGGAVWLLLGRNAVLVALYGALVISLRRSAGLSIASSPVSETVQRAHASPL